ncbi:hypothetical protein [Demequina pelophila]|uniref:hypothetical protein n=1 Tax=Demequina pelophila TaxID=1638984 RepID=UPI000781D26F|nr:hypothetical protein [Demequina pelophila]
MHGAPPPAPSFASWQPGILPLRPLTFGDYLAAPFKAMRANRSVVLGGPLLLTLVSVIATTGAMWLLFTEPSLGLVDPASQATSIRAETVLVAIVAVVSWLLADVFSSAIVAPGVGRAVLGERITLGDAWRAVRPRIGALLLLYVLVALAAAALVAVVLAPLLLAFAGDDAAAGLGLSLTVVLAIGSVIPALAVSVVAGLARPVIVLERRGAVAALRRATSLIRGRFWFSVLVLVVAGLIIGLVSGVLQQVGSLVAFAAMFALPEAVWLQGILFALGIGLSLVISYVLTYSYMGGIFALMMIDMRIRHEGFDLELARTAEARRAR